MIPTHLELSSRPLSALKPYKKNARTHSAKQVAQIAASISATAFANPILIDEDDEIIAGHGRLLAAKKLGLESVPVIQLSGLDAVQKRLLRIADNKIALNSGWDTDLLRVELEAITVSGFDLELTGFSIGEIDMTRAGGSDPDDEVIPAVPKVALTRPGDIWNLGAHRLACGDVRDAALLDRLFQGQRADAAFLDPPYNVKIDGHAGGLGKNRHREFAFASGEMTEEQFIAFLRETHAPGVQMSRNGAVHFICMDHHHVDQLITAVDELYGKRLNICVWRKSNAGMGALYRSQHELVLVYRVGDAAHRNNVELGKHGRNRTNVWDYPSVNTFKGSRRHDLALHPTVKPIALVADAILDVTKPGEIVFDGFLGSGTTLIAAERTGRLCRGVEYDPLYVDIILERWAAMTGLTPLLEGAGEDPATLRQRRSSESETSNNGDEDERS
jgi:DNA modification methylase